MAAELKNTSSLVISAIFKLILKVPRSILLTTPFKRCKILFGFTGLIPFKPALVTDTIIPDVTPWPVASPQTLNKLPSGCGKKS